jgi:hypothetical protein
VTPAGKDADTLPSPPMSILTPRLANASEKALSRHSEDYQSAALGFFSDIPNQKGLWHDPFTFTGNLVLDELLYILKGVFMKITIPILIVMAIGLLSGCSGTHEIDIDIEYSWNDSGSILTINYTLINNSKVNLEDVVVTFGADLTTGGNNDYGEVNLIQ